MYSFLTSKVFFVISRLKLIVNAINGKRLNLTNFSKFIANFVGLCDFVLYVVHIHIHIFKYTAYIDDNINDIGPDKIILNLYCVRCEMWYSIVYAI